ncbi:hypothetical protein [Pseudonocardia acaciae]|uniref:hypothetical protein n=1 Tax=Pseudonocardia acaciae TaxID=551276 RepID=UPI00049213BC|nr:hypothetical protein [Pseudonocardia acaciae]
MSTSKLDARDQVIVATRRALFDARCGPRVGDYVVFTDEVVRRISYIWNDPHEAQTSDGGSFHLTESGHLSFSGSLYRSVPLHTLTATGAVVDGGAWIFHHDWWTAHNGVNFQIPMRVFTCSEAAPTY